MVIKKNDIVVLTRKPKKVSNWTFGHAAGTVGEVVLARGTGPYPYYVRFLSDSVGCASIFSEKEIKLAPPKVRKKYTATFIKKLFGRCNKRGCTESCKHSRS